MVKPNPSFLLLRASDASFLLSLSLASVNASEPSLQREVKDLIEGNLPTTHVPGLLDHLSISHRFVQNLLQDSRISLICIHHCVQNTEKHRVRLLDHPNLILILRSITRSTSTVDLNSTHSHAFHLIHLGVWCLKPTPNSKHQCVTPHESREPPWCFVF